MRRFPFIVLAAGCLCMGACQQKPSQRDLERHTEMMEQRGRHLQNLVAQYLRIGMAEVTAHPGGARLFVDGGEYLGDPAVISLPVGTHEFRATWPDGASVTRKVFVHTSVPDTVKVDYTRDTQTGPGQATVKFTAASEEEWIRTRIRLDRPKK